MQTIQHKFGKLTSVLLAVLMVGLFALMLNTASAANTDVSTTNQLTAAIRTAPDNTPTTITLQADIKYSGDSLFVNDKIITFNLNGHNLYINGLSLWGSTVTYTGAGNFETGGEAYCSDSYWELTGYTHGPGFVLVRSTVIVYGDVTATPTPDRYIDAAVYSMFSNVIIYGDVTGYDTGVIAYGYGDSEGVTIYGNVNAKYLGVWSYGDKVTVIGDVFGGAIGVQVNSGPVFIDGNVISYGRCIGDEYDELTITGNCIRGGTTVSNANYLVSAMDDVPDDTPTIITLIDDINCNYELGLSDKIITFDLNGHNLCFSNGIYLGSCAVDYIGLGNFEISGQAFFDYSSCEFTSYNNVLGFNNGPAITAYYSTVIVHEDVTAPNVENEISELAIYSQYSDVTIYGNVVGGTNGIYARGDGTSNGVTIHGSVTADDMAVHAQGDKVTVYGNVFSGNNGVFVEDDSIVFIDGNVLVSNDYDAAVFIHRGELTVTGKVSGGKYGIYNQDIVVVVGDVTSETGVHSSGLTIVGGNVIASSVGVEAYEEAEVTIDGTIKSEGAYIVIVKGDDQYFLTKVDKVVPSGKLGYDEYSRWDAVVWVKSTETELPELDSLNIVTLPDKTEYTLGESLDLSGLSILAVYSDKSTKPITDYTTNPTHDTALISLGTQTVFISYTENTITVTTAFVILIVNAPVHEHNYATAITDQTCTEQGYTTYTCTCGDEHIADYVPALGHDWDNGVVTKEPSEQEEGTMTYTCQRCQETRTETIPTTEHAHNYAATITDPTCTEQGYTTYTCVCGESYIGNYVDALGHDFVLIDHNDATETEDGYDYYECSCCDETKTVTIPVTGGNKVVVCGVELEYRVENGIVILEPTQAQINTILQTEGNDIVIDLRGFASATFRASAAWFKDTNKTITFITEEGNATVNTKALWNNSGKDRLVQIYNGNAYISNI
jgi:hypothetical protein